MSEWTETTEWELDLVDTGRDGGRYQTTETGTLRIEGGALIFRDQRTGALRRAHGPGAWLEVWPVASGRREERP